MNHHDKDCRYVCMKMTPVVTPSSNHVSVAVIGTIQCKLTHD